MSWEPSVFSILEKIWWQSELPVTYSTQTEISHSILKNKSIQKINKCYMNWHYILYCKINNIFYLVLLDCLLVIFAFHCVIMPMEVVTHLYLVYLKLIYPYLFYWWVNHYSTNTEIALHLRHLYYLFLNSKVLNLI